MRRSNHAGGRIFRRKSRLTGQALSTWTMVYTVDGKQHRESTGEADKEEALKVLRKRQVEIDEGRYTGPERDRLTVRELLDSVVLHYEMREHHSLRTVKGHVAVWKKALGARRALDVTTGRLQQCMQTWRHDGLTPATINRRLAILRRAYRLGKVRLDPARLDFTDLFLPENSPRGRYLTADAFAAIHAQLPQNLQNFFEFAYLCGTRKQQLARTTWSHLNSETWVLSWNPQDTKTKEPHVLPLDGRPFEIIEARHAERRLHCRYVFHGPRCAPGVEPSQEYGCVGDFKRAWETACKRAGFPLGRKQGGYVFHNTRHTAVTNLVNAGTPAHEAMNVSGHRTRSVFDRYSIRVDERTRAALRATTAYTDALRTGERTVIPLPRRADQGRRN
jgi:integrase